MKTALIVLTFLTLAVLHQDAWNWDNANLVFGFIPVGLAYHAGYSLVAATFWFIVMKVAWPDALERWADGEEIVESAPASGTQEANATEPKGDGEKD